MEDLEEEEFEETKEIKHNEDVKQSDSNSVLTPIKASDVIVLEFPSAKKPCMF